MGMVNYDLWEGTSKGLVVYLEHSMVDSCRWISFRKTVFDYFLFG